MINQQQPRFCVIFFSKINPDAHVSTKMNTFTFYNRSLGAIAPRSQRNVKKWRLFLFFYQMLHTCRIDSPVMMWIQICARGVRGHAPPNILSIYLSPSTGTITCDHYARECEIWNFKEKKTMQNKKKTRKIFRLCFD